VPSLDATWRKSTRSYNDGSCLEARWVEEVVEIRDTKDRNGPVLSFTSAAWRSFVHAVHAGEFDRP